MVNEGARISLIAPSITHPENLTFDGAEFYESECHHFA